MWIKCNTDSRKTASIFTSQEQMMEIESSKKIRSMVDQDECRLCGQERETVQHLLTRGKKNCWHRM